MHPAGSVIALTTTTGAGYGLITWLAALAQLDLLPATPGFGSAAFALALALVTAGLLASTWHLGHPERAWRALSQWRSSWLSREGLLALLAYPPVLVFAGAWVVLGTNQGLAGTIGLIGATLALATVYAQSMIYASLRTIPAWCQPWTPVTFLAFALMTGSLLLTALAALFGLEAAPTFAALALVLTLAAFVAKAAATYTVARAEPVSTAGTATGLGRFGTVRLMESPHTEANYLLREMGFEIARRHALRLRQLMGLSLFAAPTGLLALGLAAGTGWLQTLSLVLASLSAALGIVLERWLFFAEAKHVVTLYYGRSVA